MSSQSLRGSSPLAAWAVLFLALILWGIAAIAPQDLLAQDDAGDSAEVEKSAATPAATDSAEPAEGKSEEQNMLLWLIETSGLIGAVILAISIFFVHRVVTLFLELRPEAVSPPDLVAQYDALLAKRDYNGIYQASKQGDSQLAKLVTAGLTVMSSGLNEAREAMDRAGESITVQMEKRISMLAVIGSLGPMIGLLGTLKGMIASFSVIAISGQQLKANEVARGISEALVLTFEGVGISVPAIYFFALFKDRVATMTVDVQNLADEFIRKIQLSAQPRGQA